MLLYRICKTIFYENKALSLMHDKYLEKEITIFSENKWLFNCTNYL